MSVLEAMAAADAELSKEIEEAQPAKEEVQVQPEEEEQESTEAVEETKEESQEEGETAEGDDIEGDDVEESEPEGEAKPTHQEKAQKGWKLRQDLKAEKEKREVLEKQFNDMQNMLMNAGISKEQIAQAQQQQVLLQQQQDLQAQQKAEPDKDLDREEWFEWKGNQQQAQIDKQAQLLEQFQQQTTIQQCKQELQAYESLYTKEFSQYGDAKDFLKTSYKNELKLQHPHATDIALNQEIERQELILANNAAAGGMNPAEAIKRMAEARGFKPEVAATKAAGKKMNISKMAQNQKRSASLINKSGETKKEKLNAQDILDMSFDNRNKLNSHEWGETEVPYQW